MVNRKRSNQKKLNLTDEEKTRSDEAKKDTGLTDHAIYNLGVLAAKARWGEPIPKGPLQTMYKFDKGPKVPGYKYGKDAKLRPITCRNCKFSFKSDAPLHGSLCPRCGYNSIETGTPEWRKLTCTQCGNSYETARLGPSSSFCWRCKSLVKEVVPFVWKQPQSTGPRQDEGISDDYAAELEEHRKAEADFNAEQMKRKTNRMAKDRKTREE